MDAVRFARSRRDLHGVAEGLLAGPQYVAHGTIRLRVTPGGFGTVVGSELRVDELSLVSGASRVPLRGSYGDVALALGLEFHVPDHYHDHSGVTVSEPIEIHEDDAALIADWFARGEAALSAFAPGEAPVLWPEHFDLGIAVDDVNYGVSPGDGFLGEPYAYVGPWDFREWSTPAAFWNAPFGAVLLAGEVADVQALEAFFREAREASSQVPRSPRR